MITRKKNISMTRGDTLSFAVHFKGLEGQNLDDAYFSCSSNYMSNDYIFIKKLYEGINKEEDESTYPDTYIFRVDPSDTENAAPGLYYYDIEVHINGDVYTVLAGNLLIKPDVTYKPEFFFDNAEYVSNLDASEYFEALDAVSDGFYINDEDYINLAVRMSEEYEVSKNYIRRRFVTHGGNLYRAEVAITNSKIWDENDVYSGDEDPGDKLWYLMAEGVV